MKRFFTLTCLFLVSGFLYPLLGQSEVFSDKSRNAMGITEGEKGNNSEGQRGVEVLTIRHPSFGSFHCGAAGGSITIAADGSRYADGDVILLNSGTAVSPAVFELRCEPFRMIQLFRDAYFLLRNANGNTIRAQIIATDPPFPLVSPANAASGFSIVASVRLELEPGSTASPGQFSGTLHTTFIAE